MSKAKYWRENYSREFTMVAMNFSLSHKRAKSSAQSSSKFPKNKQREHHTLSVFFISL